MTREEWLNEAMQHIRKGIFVTQGIDWDEDRHIRVSCGFPCRGALSKKQVLGECHRQESSEDKANEIFISPIMDESIKCLETLVHECIHALDNVQGKHGKSFKQTMKKVGLEGKATATHAGIELIARLNGIISKLPAYPHHALHPVSKDKKQGTRLLKVECPSCRYTARITQKWIEIGLPTCPCGVVMQVEAKDYLVVEFKNPMEKLIIERR